MTFIKQIKNAMDDRRNYQAYGRGKIAVPLDALDELVQHFERLDSAARSSDVNLRQEVRHGLHCATEACFHSFDSDETTLIFMEALGRLIKEKQKRRGLKNFIGKIE